MAAAHDGDEEEAIALVARMADDHKRRLKRGLLRLMADELLFFWAVGLINIARVRYGMNIPGHEPIIPEALLLPVGG